MSVRICSVMWIELGCVSWDVQCNVNWVSISCDVQCNVEWVGFSQLGCVV